MSKKKPLVECHERVAWGQAWVGRTGGNKIRKLVCIGWDFQHVHRLQRQSLTRFRAIVDAFISCWDGTWARATGLL